MRTIERTETVTTEVLILYASNHGHTGRIAAGVARAFECAGAHVDVRPIDPADDVAPWQYDAVVVGASVHGGRHQHEIADWVRRHTACLNELPTAFFSVTLTAAEGTDESRATTRRLIDEFLEQTGWQPTRTQSFAGALQYREYGFWTRQLMRLLMRRRGHPTDTRRDYDYTDWEDVERFGAECAEMLLGPVGVK